VTEWGAEVFYRTFERLFVIVLLLSSMGFVDALTHPGGRDAISAQVPLATAITETGVYVWGGLFVLMRWRRVVRAARTVWPLAAFAALAPASAAWSIDPILTLRRSVLVVASTMFAIYLGERYSMRQLARLLAVAMCLMMLIVITLRVVAPAYVIDQEGAWRGLSPHKNSFGAYMGVALVLLLLVRFQRFGVLRYMAAVAAGVLLVVSHSMAALAGSVLVLAATPLWRSMRSGSKRRALVCAIAVMALGVGIYVIRKNPDTFFQLMARDPTFTGRTKLWSLVIPAIEKHPLMGYGYGAFWWTGLSGEALNIWIRIRWIPTAADNGYLDLVLDAGVLALPLFLYVFFYSLRMAVGYIRSESHPIGLWPATYLCFFLLNNVFESELLTTRSLEFLVFAAITTCLAVNCKSDLPAMCRAGQRPHRNEIEPYTLGV
jgi:exopolysaccharide production protein ExoQ